MEKLINFVPLLIIIVVVIAATLTVFSAPGPAERAEWRKYCQSRGYDTAHFEWNGLANWDVYCMDFVKSLGK
jgi:hypothetical protein